MIAFLRTLLVRSLKEFQRDDCAQMAAAISYYVLLSLFPLLIFLVGLAGLFIESSNMQRDIVDAVLENIPLSEGEGRDTVADAVRGVAGAGSGALGVLGLLGMAWSASAMFGIIRFALNKAYHVQRRRPWAQQKLLDLAMVLGLGAFFLLSIAATTVLRVARARSQQMAGFGELAETMGILWDVASYLLPLAFSFAAFAALYAVVPAQRRRLRDVWPGALVAAAVFELTKFSFSIYLEHFPNYNLVFGSLGAVAAFLFWVYLSANIMLFGAEVAHVYARLRGGELPEGAPGPRETKEPLARQAWRSVRGLFVEAPQPAGRAAEEEREERAEAGTRGP